MASTGDTDGDREFAEEFDLLAEHPEECDVDWMIPAVAEVVEQDDAEGEADEG